MTARSEFKQSLKRKLQLLAKDLEDKLAIANDAREDILAESEALLVLTPEEINALKSFGVQIRTDTSSIDAEIALIKAGLRAIRKIEINT